MTFTELALSAGAGSKEEADYLLWERTAFPFCGMRVLWHQLRHAVRHRDCKEMGGCSSRKKFARAFRLDSTDRAKHRRPS